LPAFANIFANSLIEKMDFAANFYQKKMCAPNDDEILDVIICDGDGEALGMAADQRAANVISP
jgi:hypothetical protein